MKINHTVSIVKCPAYDSGLNDAITRLLNNIGGLDSFVHKGQKVLIKPNLLTDRTPDEAVTTHPEVVRALIRLLKESGASISVADSPASAVKLASVWEKTGFRNMCDEENVPLISLEEAGSTKIVHNGFSFNIAKPVLEADLIINVPKVKTHVLTVLTAATKNFYGTLPGYQKAMLHKACPTPKKFGQLIHALSQIMPPQLNIADGIIGMEGNGPSAGKPVQLGFMAASTSALAMDIVICRILGINPSTVPYLNSFIDDYADITTNGVSIPDVTPSSFKMPNTLPSRLIPEWLVGIFAPFLWIRPAVTDNCIACGLCVKACPADALHIDPNLKKAVLTPDKCIGCCCCHEVCPEKAIEMALSPFLNLLRKGKKP